MCAEGRGRTRKVRGSKPFAEGLAEAHERARNPCVVVEALSRKQIPKFSRKTFAEAAAEGGSKKDYKRYSQKDRGRASRKG